MTEGPVKRTLLKLSLPMIFGLLGMVLFNLVDIFFVGKLGTAQLAALSFTFPVVLVVGSLSLGMGFGASSLISRFIGKGDTEKVELFTLSSFLLALFLAAGVTLLGITFFYPAFKVMGASADTLPLIRQYMIIWYSGLIFVIIPMVGNNLMRAVGDTLTPGIIMTISFFTNAILDPLLIFGIGPFPRLGISGAAIATVLARSLTFAATLYILIKRKKMLRFFMPPWS